MNPSTFIDPSCGFCVEINDLDADNNLLKSIITPQTGLESRYVYENDEFIVMPTLGAFVEGYVMIVPKTHYDCIGKMPLESIDALAKLSETIKKQVKEAYGTSVICFEHGSVSCANKFGGCLNHAHLHILPCNVSLIEEISEYDLEISLLPNLSVLHDYGSVDNPYLFFEDISGEQYVITGEYIVSQFFRKLVANHIGLSEAWDWRENLFLENVLNTVRRLKQDDSQ